MARKRARLGEDNDPLTSTDKVLQGFEELSKSTEGADKSASQEVEDMEASKTNKSTSRQAKKSTRQPANKSTIRQSRRKKTSPSNTSKQDTQEVNKSGSKQVSKRTSQQDENIASQEVPEILNNQSTDKIKSQEVAEKKDILLTYQEVNKSTSQQDKQKASQEVKQNKKESDNLGSQQVNKSVVRKSTFQLSSTILERLDRLHLELQLELGKQDAPYKEVIVEEAIARLLEVAVENRSELVEALLERQGQRK